MATSVVFPRVQFFADNGRLLIGGHIHTYIAGTSSRAPTYKDAARAQPNTNPIILDGRAEASIYLAEGVEYKFVVEDSNGSLIMTQEPVYGAIWPNAEDWPSDATLAYQYMLDARAAAESIGVIKFYDTYAQAQADLPNLAEDDLVEIYHDETRTSSPRARYKVASGALVFVIEFDVFYPGYTGSVPRPIQSKLREIVSVKDFGAVGDGIADDTVAIQLAVAATEGGVLDWGDLVYRCTAPVSLTVSGTWRSSGAQLVYDGMADQNIAFNLTLAGSGLSIDGRMIFDGQNKCAKPLYVGNSSDTLRSFSARRIICRRGRKTTADYGAGLLAEGNFDVVDVSGGLFEAISMADGVKATPGVVGCIIKASSPTQYPRLVYINDAVAKDIYADGYDYLGDQDGFRIFGPDNASDTHPHRMQLFANNISGIDCVGRTIKTQCDYAEINGVYIERNVVSAIAPWGIDIDVQTGGGYVRNVQAVYRGHVPNTTVLVNSTIAAYSPVPYAQVDGVQITNVSGISLREMLLIGSRDVTKAPQVFASGFRAIGLLTAFVRSSPLTNTNGLTISLDGMVGSPSLGAFVTEASSSTGRLFARSIVNLGADTVPFWRRSSAGQIYEIAAIDCPGWLTDRRVIPATNNPAVSRIGRCAPVGVTRSGTEILLSKELIDGEIWELPPHGWNNDGIYLIKVGAFHGDYALISAGTTNIASISIGGTFQIGALTEPGSGSYRVWTSADGLRLANRSGATRMITVKAIG